MSIALLCEERQAREKLWRVLCFCIVFAKENPGRGRIHHVHSTHSPMVEEGASGRDECGPSQGSFCLHINEVLSQAPHVFS